MLGNMSTLKSGGKRPKLRQSGLEWVGEVEEKPESSITGSRGPSRGEECIASNQHQQAFVEGDFICQLK